jgi:TonB family protein
MFALLFAPLLAAATAGMPAYAAACPERNAQMLAGAMLVPPDGIHPTNRRARFLLDLGSDGRIRRAALVESSGDAAFDGAALKAAGRIVFAPSSQGCISPSSVVPESFDVPLIVLAHPAANPSGPPVLATAPPAADVTICAAPFVQLNGIGLPDTRQAPGTVTIDVRLDAAARVIGVQLAKPSGNKTTDATALALARDAEYAFEPQPGCGPKPTTYPLELTFH